MDENQLRLNVAVYAPAYLQEYARVLERRLAPAVLIEARSAGLIPLYGLEYRRDVTASAFCSIGGGSWIFFTKAEERFAVSVDPRYGRDWIEVNTAEEVFAEVEGLLGISRDAVLYRVWTPATEWLALRTDPNYIKENAIAHARDHARRDAAAIPAHLETLREAGEAEAAVAQIRGALAAKGTQEAGYELERGFRALLRVEGWNPAAVRITGQQIDVVGDRDGHYVFVELVNRVTPATAEDVRDLSGKLQTRPPVVVGILGSASGFTNDAREEARRLASHRAILLFGPVEFEAILAGGGGFTQVFKMELRVYMERIEP